MRPYILGENMEGIVGAQGYLDSGEGLKGGMIAHDPNNTSDQWYVSKEYFEANYMEYVNEWGRKKGRKGGTMVLGSIGGHSTHIGFGADSVVV